LVTRFFHRFSLVLIVVLLGSQADALVAELRPSEIIPGDVFLIRVLASGTPSGEFKGGKIRFFMKGDDEYMALVPVPLDTEPGDYRITIKDGREARCLDLRVRRYEFPTERLTLPEEKVFLSPENQKRVEREYLMLQDLWDDVTERMWDGVFIQPVDTRLSEAFGIRRIINSKKTSIHRGIDYKGTMGEPVRAINSGRVVLADELFYGGKTVIIDHGTGLFSIYMHLSGFNVSKGQNVSKGHIIGFIGATGRATGPHLHLSVKLGGISVNPLSLMNLDL
jgi:murein DD-endopeptidase MepM/ murein hydrolase activator NlpD